MELTQQAVTVYLDDTLGEKIQIDSSLILLNRALSLDDRNMAALDHKATLLFRIKDAEGLVQIADRLIELEPDKPFYKGQKAVYLELMGKTDEAQRSYQQSITAYQRYLAKDSLDFDMLLEYVGILDASGDSLQAKSTLKKMETMGFQAYQNDIISLYTQQRSGTHLLKQYWRGEIEYYDLEGL